MIIQDQKGCFIEISVFHLEYMDVLTAYEHRAHMMPTLEQLFPVTEDKEIHPTVRKLVQGTTEMAQWLRAFVFTEDTSSISSTNMMAHNHPNSNDRDI